MRPNAEPKHNLFVPPAFRVSCDFSNHLLQSARDFVVATIETRHSSSVEITYRFKTSTHASERQPHNINPQVRQLEFHKLRANATHAFAVLEVTAPLLAKVLDRVPYITSDPATETITREGLATARRQQLFAL